MPENVKINAENNELYIKMVKVLKDYSDKFSHPIKHKELAEMDEYNKSLYFRMLCMLSQCENTTNDKQIWFLNRLIEGNTAEEKLEAYMVKALDIDSEDIDAFINAFQESGIKFYFVIDALIILNLSEMKKDQTDIVATITDLFKISERDLMCISLLAKAILLNNIAIYDEAKTWTSSETKHLDLFDYIRDFYVGNYSLDDNIARYYSSEPTELELFGSFEYESMMFENCKIIIKNGITFNGCKEVVFINSQLTGSCMVFERVSSVSFDKCEMDEFKSGIARINYVESLRITECLITNSESSGDLDGIFDVDNDVKSILVSNNIVRNCLSQGGDVRDYALFMSVSSWEDDIISAKNNEFVNCSKKGDFGSPYIFDCLPGAFAINENNRMKNCHHSVQLMRR